MADNPHHHTTTRPAGLNRAAGSTATTDLTGLTTLATAQQAAAALQQGVIDASITADRQGAATAAHQAAAELHQAAAAKARAAAAKAAAAARAAREAAASRSEVRTPLSGSTAAPATSPAATVAAASSSKVDRLITFLKSQLGKPYVYGATGPDSYDCSGLTQVAFGTVGVSLPRTSQEQSTVGTPVSTSALQPGDLIFWGGEGSAYHVGVFIGNGQYLDAANPSTPVAIHQLADYMPDWAVRVL